MSANRHVLIGLVALSLGVLRVHAQYSGDYQTNIISGVVSNWTGDYVVGNENLLDLLLIESGGVLSNTNGFIGNAANANFNAALVRGSGSLWTNTGALSVGVSGTGNSLTVSNGAVVVNTLGYVGFGSTSSNNSVLVADSNSIWRIASASGFTTSIGHDGSGNSLTISNGGTVYDYVAAVGYNAISRSNSVLLTGSGSVWSNWSILRVGYNGGFNRMVISDGAKAFSTYGDIGYANTSGSNQVLITGAGSVWSNAADFNAGNVGAGNSLIISNGGYFYSGGYGNVGDGAGGSNKVEVVGPGSTLVNGGTFSVGRLGDWNSLTIRDGATVFSDQGVVGYNALNGSNNMAWVTGAGSVWGSRLFFVGGGGFNSRLVIDSGAWVTNREASVNGYALITDAGSVWSNSFQLAVGAGLPSGQLVISNNAVVYSLHSRVLGLCSAVLTDTGSVWTALEMIVGPNSELTVRNGAVMYGSTVSIGDNSFSSNSVVTITDPGTVWSNTGTVNVGLSNRRNTLIISNGAVMSAPALIVNSNCVLSGSDAVFNLGILKVGRGAANFTGACQLSTTNTTLDYFTNQFLIGDTLGKSMSWSMVSGLHTVSSAGLVIGGAAGGSGRVTMTGAQLFSSGIVYVGSNGVGNGTGSLVMSNGLLRAPGLVSGYAGSGTISNFGGLFQFTTGAPQILANTANSIVGVGAGVGFFGVADAPVDLTTTGLTNIEWQGGISRYRLSSSTNAAVETYIFGTDNPQGLRMLELTGGTTYWQSSNLVIGAGGTLFISNTVASVQNMLTITNGGQAVSLVGLGGFNARSTGTTIVVTGSNSVWNSLNDLIIGQVGLSNALIIKDGGTVYDQNGSVGYSNVANGSSVLVTDPGSVWSNRVDMFIGYAGSENQLSLANQGAVFARTGYVGFATSSRSNQLSISGGAELNSLAFMLGCSGSVNQASITDGSIIDSSGFIGFSSASSSNSVSMTGSGSSWSNWAVLYVGYGGRANTLTIDNGANVYSLFGYVGVLGSATNNLVNIIGTNSVWNAPGGVVIGYGGAGNGVQLAGGQLIATPVTISNLNLLSGCGTVTGFIDNNGTITATGCGSLTFLGPVVNGGTLRAIGGGVLDFQSPVVNHGYADFSGGSVIYRDEYLDLSGPTNSWIVPASGLWTDAADWSLGHAPAQQMAVLLTNATTKTVTINATTPSLAPTSMTNFNVVISAPVGTTNTLFLDNVGTNVPFRAITMTVASRGELVISDSAVQAGWYSYYGDFLLQGKVRIDGGILDVEFSQFLLGQTAPGASVIITNGGVLRSTHSYVGVNLIGSNNVFTVGGAGSVWSNILNIYFGDDARGNQLFITNNGVVKTRDLYMGYESTSLSNRITVASTGTLSVEGWLWIRRGVLEMRGGVVEANTFEMDDGATGTISFNAGLLRSYESIVANTRPFIVGNATNAATFELTGGTHSFADGLRISSNSFLTGCGTISGSVLNEGTILADCGGTLQFSGIITNNGTMIATNGTTLAFYGLAVNNGLIDSTAGSVQFYGGVTNNGTILPPTTPAAQFNASTTNGAAPLSVTFTDTSTGTITNRFWNFGDGATTNITDASIRHTYTSAGANTVTLIVSGPLGSSTNSQANLIAVQLGSLDHFAWSPISSPQLLDTAFAVTVTAQDAGNDTITDFAGVLALSGQGTGAITNRILGNVSHTSSANFGTYTLGYSFTPTNDLTVTHVRSYCGTLVSIWTDAGVLLTTQNVTSVPGTWVETPLATPVQLLATNTYRVGVYTGGSTYYSSSNGATNFPNGTIDKSYWSTGNAFPATSDSHRWWLVDLRYTIPTGISVPITPTNSGNFVGGVWTGAVTVLQTTTAMSLLAQDGSGRSGTSTLFTVASTGLMVTPANGLTSTGPQGGLFSPASKVYTLTNSGTDSLTWQATNTTSWVSLSATSGSLAAGSNTTVTILINTNANLLSVGSDSDSVVFTNLTAAIGSTTRAVSLTVNIPGVLTVTPTNGLTSTETQGGLFTPSSQNYTLSNTGGSPIWWSATHSNSWVSLSAPIGLLATGTTQTVTVSINTNANGLTAGSYSDTVAFNNLSNGSINTTRGVGLTVIAAVPPAASFTATPTNGWTPLSVTFTDTSTGTITNRSWSFGDGGTTNVLGTTVIYVYTAAGTDTVTLIASGPLGAATNTQPNCIVVTQTTSNSWSFAGSGKWEVAGNWSEGIPPNIVQPALYITNAISKTVTIDTVTTNTPNCLSISNLTVHGTGDATNTLLLNNFGTVIPLQILSEGAALTLDTNAWVVVNHSALVAPRNGRLIVGDSGAGSSLLITNGGNVTANWGYIGNNVGSSNNMVLVDGPGSIWTCSQELFVGYSGSSNTLIITNGGSVLINMCLLGYNLNSGGNLAVVTGQGSIWTNTYLYVGYNGSSNRLVIANGGQVVGYYSYLGYNFTTSPYGNNIAVVTDTGSVWNTANLYIGYSDGTTKAGGNTLVITNGGTVISRAGYLSYENHTPSNMNVARITGPGSLWNSGTLYVGWNGFGNELAIGGGGAVVSSVGYVGYSSISRSSNNLAVVRDAGSVWSNSSLYVGYGTFNCSANQLVITNGGTVFASNLVVGAGSLASNNLVRVESGTLRVTAGGGTGGLIVGQTGQGRLLLDTGTVMVDQLVLTNGANSVFTLNAGTLSSGGTFVTNNQLFVVGDGMNAATFQLNGGVHSFANNLEIRNNASLTGCGTISGNVLVDSGGTVLANCAGGQIAFTGVVTNNATIIATNGATLMFYGLVVNNALIDATAGSVQFLGGLVNNDTILQLTIPAAQFNASTTNGAAPLSVTFTDSSTGTITNRYWSFGDGATTNLTGTTIVHTYTLAGTNTVTLIVSGPLGSSTNSQANYIEIMHSSGSNSWMYAGDGKWEDASKWSLGVAPANGQSIFLTNATTKTVMIDATTTNTPSSMQIWDLTVSAPRGMTNTIINSIGRISLPLQVLNTLDLGIGGALNLFPSLGPGAIVVDQAGISGNASNGLIVGYSSRGTMRMHGGSALGLNTIVGFNPGATGTLTVEGGTNVLQDLVVGYKPSSTGTVWLSSGIVTANTVNVGGPGFVDGSPPGGVGQLTISNASLIVRSVTVGLALSGNSSCGTLTIAGGTLEVTSGLGFNIAIGANCTGTVWMTGGQLITTSSSIFVGSSPGQMTISNGLVIGSSLGVANKGQVTLAGGITSLSANLTLYPPGVSNFVVAGGALYVTNRAATARINCQPGGGLMLVNGSVTADTFDTGGNSAGGLMFSGGTLATKGTWASNGVPFVVGNGTNAATFRLNGGFHSFSNGLVIATNALLTGCGSITGSVLNQGTILGDCGGVLAFSGIVTNNGTIIATNGETLAFYGLAVNNGLIDATAGSVQFYGGSINNGTILQLTIPAAQFNASTTNGAAPLAVIFTDTSTGTITNRFWSFGDGATTNTLAVNVQHLYTAVGTNTVTLIVSGPVGISTNTQADYVRVVHLLPTVVTQPQSQTVTVGGTATFSVLANGEGTLVYQWQKAGSNLSGGGHYSGVTTSNLTVSAVDSSTAADYRCLVSNDGGSVSSAAATLTVQADLITGLVGYWSFDAADVSGNTLYDRSGNGSHATAYNSSSVTGAVGSARHFTGSASYAVVPADTNLLLTGDRTLALWLRTSNLSRYEGLISRYSSAGNEAGYLLRTTAAGVLDLRLGGGNLATGASGDALDTHKINDGVWHHAVVVIKLGSGVTFYIDGVRSSSTALPVQAGTGGSTFQMAANPWLEYGNYFTGDLDEMRIYSRALSDTEAAALARPGAGDSTPPTVSLTAPSNGQSVTGSVAVAATASDDTGVAGVQFRLDGVNLGAEDTAAPYAVAWNTVQGANGDHSLLAIARDTSGNSATSSVVAVTVNNDVTAPVVTLTAPVNSQIVSNLVTVSATATDDVRVVGVQFKVDGANLGAEDPTAPYAATWDTTSVTNGLHSLSVLARDAVGHQTTGVVVTVTVANPVLPPTVTITAPANGQTVSNSVNVTATAAAGAGVVGVQFQLDGANWGAEDTVAPYAIIWNTIPIVNGAHALKAVARDTVGNATTSTPVNVTVNNDLTPPVVAITAPASGQVLSNSVTVSATATDNVAVVGVQFKLDGANLGAEDTTAPYAVTWDTTPVANGPHTLSAVARDAAGNQTNALAVAVTVSNTTSVTTGLLAYWSFDAADVNGNTLYDRSGNSSHATAYNSSSVTGAVGSARHFTGSASYAVVPADTNLLLTGDRTLALWLRTSNLSRYEGLISRYSSAGNEAGYLLRTTAAGVLDLRLGGGNLATGASGDALDTHKINDGVWHHAVVVIKLGSGVTFYIDGVRSSSTALPVQAGTGGSTFQMAANPWLEYGNYFTGDLDEMRIYSRALSDTEAAVLARPGASDSAPPTVSLTAPSNGQSVTGSVTVAATASDDTGVAGVQFRLDGVNLGTEDIAAPYAVVWNTAQSTNGVHSLTAIARDSAGNTATSIVVAVTVNNDVTAPVVTLTAPTNNQTVSNLVTVSATATDDVSAVGVQFKVDGANLGAEDPTAPYAVTWDTTSVANGLHSLSVLARDAVGHQTTGAVVTVTVANPVLPPTVTITAPANGQTVSNSVNVTATATAGAGVTGVQFQLDGANWGTEDTVAPYAMIWNTIPTANGAHVLRAVARDAVGNVTTSTVVNVTVNNDLTPPVVAITAPAPGQALSNSVTVSASATDNVAVVGVQFKLDGANLGAEDTTVPYAVTWDTTPVANGPHTLSAVARDAAGNQTNALAVAVTVSNTTSVTTGLLAYWSFDAADVNGNTLYDRSGNGSHATAYNSGLVTGSVGSARHFTGAASYAVVQADTNLLLTGDRTLALWLRTSNLSRYEGLISRYSSAGNEAGYLLRTTAAGVLDLRLGGGNLATGASGDALDTHKINDGVWHHVVVVIKLGSGVTFYIDGVRSSSTALPVQAGTGGSTFQMAANPWLEYGNYFTGDLDEMRIYSRALNDAEAAALARPGAGDSTPPTVSLTAPAAGQTVTGSVAVAATAADDTGVAGVQFRLDGANLGAEDIAAPYAVAWNTAQGTNGVHSLLAIARDTSGNSTTSLVVAVTVNNDVTPPVVTLTAPVNSQIVSNLVTVSATATDDVRVVGVQFKVDGANLGAEDPTAPYAATWDTTSVTNGLHSLSVLARDAVGHQTTGAVVTVTVANPVLPPTVTITAPANGQTVSNSINVTATATAGAGVAGVQFQLDGANWGAEDTVAPYAITWNTIPTANGAHALTAVARDTVGNATTSTPVNVTVNNDLTPPVVAITVPSPGQVLSNSVTVSATATDNVAVVGVQFKLDGANLGAELAVAPWSVAWDTTPVANGPHTLSAVARDAAGNQTNALAVAVTVSNTTSVTTGLLAFWSFDAADVNGNTLYDRSGNGSHATSFNTTVVSTGKVNQARHFTGSGSYALVSADTNLRLTGDRTLSLWLRTSNTSRYEGLISRYAAAGNEAGYLLRTTPAGVLELRIGGANLATGASRNLADVRKINDGGWHHVVVIIKLGVGVTFYVDGVRTSITPAPVQAGVGGATFQIGSNPWLDYGNYFTGDLDQVRVHDRALSDAEVAALSQEGVVVSAQKASVRRPSVEALDTDGDGLTDRQETLAGTDPTQPNSRFRIMSIVATPAAAAVALTWTSVPGQAYRVQYAETVGGPWREDLPNSQLTAGPGQVVLTYTDATAPPAGSRYYAVRLVPGAGAPSISVATEPVGVYGLTLQPGDNPLAVPLQRLADYRGAVVSVVNSNTVQLSSTAGFVPGQFGPRAGLAQYILLVRHDAAATPGIAGDWWPITGNTATQVTVENDPDDLPSLLASGAQIEIRHLTTLADLFGSALTSADCVWLGAAVEIGWPVSYQPVGAAPGYYQNGIFLGNGSTITLAPDQALTVSRPAGSASVTVRWVGQVQVTPLTHYLEMGLSLTGNPFPVAARLDQIGLATAGWVADANLQPNAADEDLIQAIGPTGLGPAVIYHNGSLGPAGWYVGGVLSNGMTLTPGQAYRFSIKAGSGMLRWRQPAPVTP